MNKLAILHFSPIEQYPPVLNLLNFLAAKENSGFQVRVITMKPGSGFPAFKSPADHIRIIRRGGSNKKGLAAYLSYLTYYAGALLQLITWRPDTILYYETISCFPALIFKKYLGRRSSLFIHYHEYASENEYRQGTLLNRWGHRLEKNMYHLVKGISHTNEDRIRLFREDLAGFSLPPIHAFPNYPPVSWRPDGRQPTDIGLPVRLVYVGALSLDTMYTRELVDWVMKQDGKVIWDIYSDNMTDEARAFLGALKSDWVHFRKGVNYYVLPQILAGYDIGIILYKGHIQNYVHNAPNKLFEYLACGLDVWFPDVMLGCHPFVTRGVYPKVMAVDFQDLAGWQLGPAIDHTGLQNRPSEFYAEHVLPKMLHELETP